MTTLYRRYSGGPLLRKSTTGPGTTALAGSEACCCHIWVAINVVNVDKRADETHEVKINGHTLTQPTVDTDIICGGGYYTNVDPAPDFCTLEDADGVRFRCCGAQRGGHCDETDTDYVVGQYPATGSSNDDPCRLHKESFQQECGDLGDCSGEYAPTQVFPTGFLNTGLNTLEVNKIGADKPQGSYGLIEIAELRLVAGVWTILGWRDDREVTGDLEYDSGDVSHLFNLTPT